MNYFKKLLNIQELSQRRVDQIEKEEKFDNCLKESYEHCPALVLQYLFKTREINRKYSKETYKASVFEYPDKAEKNLDIIDKMHSAECSGKICKQLSDILKDLEKL